MFPEFFNTLIILFIYKHHLNYIFLELKHLGNKNNILQVSIAQIRYKTFIVDNAIIFEASFRKSKSWFPLQRFIIFMRQLREKSDQKLDYKISSITAI